MPVYIIQANSRAAEVKFVCDICGKPNKTSMVPIKEAQALKNTTVNCWNCKQAQANKH